MGLAEYEHSMSDVVSLENGLAKEAFEKLHESAKKLHIDEIPELERFKSIMDKLQAVESDIALIKNHFKIVPIIGGNP